MSFPNSLPINCYKGAINGIDVKWTATAITYLPNDAKSSNMDEDLLKVATEQKAYDSAKRLNKTAITIL